MGDIDEKYRALRSLLKKTGGLVVGYSGGCDSALLAALARETLGDQALCVFFSFEAYPQREVEQALNTSVALGLSAMIVEEEMLADADFAANTPERCYFCKKKMFSRLFEIGREFSLDVVADGSNRDDFGENRPGRRAALEMGVISPLEEAGFTKDEVRKLSRQMNLPTWDKPSFACLATRIPYGIPLESASLERIGRAERFLDEAGFHQVRVRHHGDIARIEVAPDEIERMATPETGKIVASELKKLGYLYVALDLTGYKTGSMDTGLTR
jgi:uncharacterized protein